MPQRDPRARRGPDHSNPQEWSIVEGRLPGGMRCLKAFGERIAARDPNRQIAGIHIRIALMNRFSALGTTEIERVS